MKPCKNCGSLNKYGNGRCKTCHAVSAAKWEDKNKEKQKLYHKQRHEKYPDEVRENHLKKKYGITLAEYNVLFEVQQGCCAICGRHQAEFKHSLAVDHNHTTGQVRGLLCIKCNTAIGSLNEDKELFKLATKYLTKW